ncbi:hypothetical protein ACEE90_00010 [Corynebacterium phoceense]
MRLFFSVLETYTFVVYSIMLLLWGILAPVKGPVAGGSLAFLVVVVVLSTTVTKTKATALGLSRKMQTRYNLGLAAYYVVLGAAVSVARQWWWLTAAVVVAWSIRAVVTLRQTPQSAASSDAEVHDLEERISGEGNTSFGRFPVTPAAQLVFRPLLRAWMWVVAGYAAVALSMWAAVAWGDIDVEYLNIVFVIMTMWTLGALMNSYRTSFREFLTLGGTRRVWVRTVALLSAAWAIAGVAMKVAVWATQGIFTGFLFGISVLIPVLGVSWELVSRRTILWTAGLGATALVFLILALTEVLPRWSFAVSAVVLYLLWVALLPLYARTANPYRGGMLEWLGIS